MKSIIQLALEDTNLINIITEAIKSKMLDSSGTAYDSQEGLIEGRVTNLDFDQEIKYDQPEGADLVWTVPFSTVTTSEIGYITPSGEDRASDITGPCAGTVEIAFPPTTLSATDIDQIVSGIDIEIDIESASLKEKAPESEADLPDEP